MKLSNEYSSRNLLNRTTKFLFLFLFVWSAAAAKTQAQSINDDLKPAKPPVKSPAPAAAPTPKIRKPVRTRQPVRRQPVRPAYNPTSVAAPAVAPSTIDVPPVVAAPIAAPAPPPPSPLEIFNRFIDFDQSASVTGKDWESVVKQTTETLQTSPENKTVKAQLSVAQGELAFNRADYSNALIRFRAAAQLVPDSPLPFYCLGRVYLTTKQPAQAEKAFERAIKLDKNFALAYKGLGDTLTAQGKNKKADDYYKDASRVGVVGNSSESKSGSGATKQNNLTGGESAPAAEKSESTYERDLKIARDYTSKKKWQMSLDTLEPLAETNPSADLYVAIGDNYYGMQAWLSAQQAYRKATEMNPNLAVAYFKSGMVLYETNEFQSAVDAFEKSLILDQSGATINRAQARKWADKANEKVRDLNKNVKKKGL